MPINTLEYAKIFQTELDRQLIEGATSGWMEQNAGQVKYNGGNEVKVPKISLSGLGDYDRDTGFVQGAVTLAFQTLTMTQDRGRTFQLDAMDVDETNFAASAGMVMGEFQRTKVIPEVDAYRYSKLGTLAVAADKKTEYAPTADTILGKLYADITKVKDLCGDAAEVVISIAAPTAALLNTAKEAGKWVDAGQFALGSLSLKVRQMDGSPLLPVPSARMKTAYVFNDGTTNGQEAGGIVPAAGARDIHWIITVRKSPIAVSKTDLTRIFDPMTNQKANAWKIDYRKYHELWVPEHALDGVWVCIQPA